MPFIVPAFFVSLLSTVVIKVSIALGRNVCIKHANVTPSSAGTWHLIAYYDANNFSERGERYGIGIDFPVGEVTVKDLQTVCESSCGTTMKAIDIMFYISEFLHGTRTVLVYEHIDNLSKVKIKGGHLILDI